MKQKERWAAEVLVNMVKLGLLTLSSFPTPEDTKNLMINCFLAGFDFAKQELLKKDVDACGFGYTINSTDIASLGEDEVK